MKFCQDCEHRKSNKCSITGKYAEPEHIYQTDDKNCPIRYSLDELSKMESYAKEYENLYRHFVIISREILGTRYNRRSLISTRNDIIREYENTKRSRDMWRYISWITITLLIIIIFFT